MPSAQQRGQASIDMHSLVKAAITDEVHVVTSQITLLNKPHVTDVAITGTCAVTNQPVNFVAGRGWCKQGTLEPCGPHGISYEGSTDGTTET